VKCAVEQALDPPGKIHNPARNAVRSRLAEWQAYPLAAIAGATAGVQFLTRGYRDNAGVGAGALLVVGKTVNGINAIGAIGEQLLESFDVLSAAG
jgi:hypothetical protein